MKINSDWFTKRMKAAGFRSQRALADEMTARLDRPIDKSFIAKIFNSTRRMQIQEATVIADLLDVSLSEVLTHAGIESPRLIEIEVNPHGGRVTITAPEGSLIDVKKVGEGSIRIERKKSR